MLYIHICIYLTNAGNFVIILFNIVAIISLHYSPHDTIMLSALNV